jgi:hypothetical protein
MLQERTKAILEKRQAPAAGAAPAPAMAGGTSALLAGAMKPNPNAPKSLVPQVAPDVPSTAFAGATRRKIRYGPFRIPPISVSLAWNEI